MWNSLFMTWLLLFCFIKRYATRCVWKTIVVKKSARHGGPLDKMKRALIKTTLSNFYTMQEFSLAHWSLLHQWGKIDAPTEPFSELWRNTNGLDRDLFNLPIHHGTSSVHCHLFYPCLLIFKASINWMLMKKSMPLKLLMAQMICAWSVAIVVAEGMT